MEEKEKVLPGAADTEAMLAVLAEHSRKTGCRYHPRMIRELAEYLGCRDDGVRAVTQRAAELEILDPKVSHRQNEVFNRVFVEALLEGTGLFPRSPERRALDLVYGLEDGVRKTVEEAARITGLKVEEVDAALRKFQGALRSHEERRREKLRNFYN